MEKRWSLMWSRKDTGREKEGLVSETGSTLMHKEWKIRLRVLETSIQLDSHSAQPFAALRGFRLESFRSECNRAPYSSQQ